RLLTRNSGSAAASFFAEPSPHRVHLRTAQSAFRPPPPGRFCRRHERARHRGSPGISRERRPSHGGRYFGNAQSPTPGRAPDRGHHFERSHRHRRTWRHPRRRPAGSARCLAHRLRRHLLFAPDAAPFDHHHFVSFPISHHSVCRARKVDSPGQIGPVRLHHDHAPYSARIHPNSLIPKHLAA